MASDGDKKSILNWVDPKDKSGEFKRQTSVFRNTISNEPGAEFPVESDRYHLYVSYACPWAHRALITRKLKGLDEILPFTAVHWHLGEKGWRFATTADDDSDDTAAPGENVRPDPLHGKDVTHLRDIYLADDPNYSDRFTVPMLYDKKQKRIVNNESAEIIRMLYHSFDELLNEEHRSLDLLPKDLQADIDAINEWTYNDINNGVYKSGFATTQSAYDAAVTTLFNSLDRVEAHLAQTTSPDRPFYHGARLTETDVRLFPTLIRFDAVYVQHFKCNLRDIRGGQYPAIHRWLRHLYWRVPAFGGATTNFLHIKRHYTRSHKQINPFSITPRGPVPDVMPLEDEAKAL